MRTLQHEVADRRVVAGERAQRLLPVRVGQEAHIHHDVGVERQPVLVAEALDRDLQALAVARLDRRRRCSLAFSWCMFSSVVSITRSAASRTGSSSARSSSIASTRPVGLGVERMLAARRVVALHQLGGRGIEEHDAHPMTVASQRGDLRQHVDVLAARHQAPAARCRCPACWPARRSCRPATSGRLSIDVPAEILEHRGGAGTPGARQPGDQHDVGHSTTIVLPTACAFGDTAAAGSSPRRGTRWHARGTRRAAPAPPSARSAARSRRGR